MNKTAHFYCYGAIGDEANHVSPEKMLSFLKELDKDVTDIQVHINSYGGGVYSGFNIHEQLVNSGKKVTTIVEGICASIATVIFLAGTERKITENSKLMIHAPMTGFNEDATLNAKELTTLAAELKIEENRMTDFYSQKTGMDKTLVDQMMSKDSFISPDQALELKFATEITKPIKAFAYFEKNNNKKNNEMNEKTLLEKLSAVVKSHFKSDGTPITIVAKSAKTSDGTAIYFDGELAKGTKVFSDTEMKTPMSDGSYTMEDGTTCVVTAGEVSEVKAKVEAATPPVETPQAQIAALTAKNLELETKLNAAIVAQGAAETAAVKAVSDTLAKFKSEFKPETSGTYFKNLAATASKEDRKKAIEALETAGKK